MKCTKKWDARAGPMFCLNNQIIIIIIDLFFLVAWLLLNVTYILTMV